MLFPNTPNEKDEPIYITKNGRGRMVIWDYDAHQRHMDEFQKQKSILELYKQLAEADAESEDEEIPYSEISDKINKRLGI
jgi:PHD/YefM family antitoxin component YafN of YafNO toxin-antitoxin module